MEHERQAETAAATGAAVERSAGAAEADAREGDAAEAATAASAARAERLRTDAHALRFEAYVGVGYHAAREIFFDRLGKVLTGLQVALQTSAIAWLVGGTGTATAGVIGAISAVAGVIMLVVAPAQLARDHRALRARCHMLIAKLDRRPLTEDIVESVRSSSHALDAESPAAFRALQAIAFNQVVDSMYEDDVADRERVVIPEWDRRLAQVLPFRGRRYRPPPRRSS